MVQHFLVDIGCTSDLTFLGSVLNTRLTGDLRDGSASDPDLNLDNFDILATVDVGGAIVISVVFSGTNGGTPNCPTAASASQRTYHSTA